MDKPQRSASVAIVLSAAALSLLVGVVGGCSTLLPSNAPALTIHLGPYTAFGRSSANDSGTVSIEDATAVALRALTEDEAIQGLRLSSARHVSGLTRVVDDFGTPVFESHEALDAYVLVFIAPAPPGLPQRLGMAVVDSRTGRLLATQLKG